MAVITMFEIKKEEEENFPYCISVEENTNQGDAKTTNWKSKNISQVFSDLLAFIDFRM